MWIGLNVYFFLCRNVFFGFGLLERRRMLMNLGENFCRYWYFLRFVWRIFIFFKNELLMGWYWIFFGFEEWINFCMLIVINGNFLRVLVIRVGGIFFVMGFMRRILYFLFGSFLIGDVFFRSFSFFLLLLRYVSL